MAGTYQAKAVRKAFEILEHACRSEQGMTLTELSREIGIGKSTVLGIAQALEDSGALVRDPKTKKYRAGMVLSWLGRTATSKIDLRSAARPVMEKLRDDTQETVFLGTRSGEHVHIIDAIESERDLKITSPIGTRIPLLAGATGKAILASMPHEQALAIVNTTKLNRFTDRSVTDPDRYMEAVGEARRLGYSTDDEEYLTGVRAVAASVAEQATLWVVGFTTSMGDEKFRRVAELVKTAASQIDREVRCPSSG